MTNRQLWQACGRRLTLGVLAATVSVAIAPAASAQGWGNVTGQFVLDGAIPEPAILIKIGDPQAKDPQVCAAANLLSDSLRVDPATKGVSDVFVYLKTAPAIHPALAKSTQPELTFDQKGCRFIPHSLVVRTDQTVRVLSDDPVAHNTHTFPIKNMAVNFLLRPNERKGIAVPNVQSELLPFQVKCDIHPWMLAHWLVLDHPYAAVTNERGEFKIDMLPEGTHEFRVWHEKVGYVDRAYKVTVKAGETTKLEAVAVPVAKFQ